MLKREPVLPTVRLSMSPARKARILALYDGRCAKCGGPGPFVFDHVLPLWMGGADENFNIEPICEMICNKVKTSGDQTDIAKVKRIIRKADPSTRPKSKRPLRGRGFDKTLSRHFDQTVTRRQT